MKKILIVDDEKYLQELVKDILLMDGYRVATADDGVEGLKKIYEEDPDLVILDCQMPRMDGYEVLASVRKDPLLINKPIIMLTAKSSEADQLRGLRLGIDDYIVKPFKPNLLLARIKTVLERKSLSLGANPLTLLAGNVAINFEVEKRLLVGAEFALLYLDLSDFKSYNDKYGFERGDAIIKHTASILVQTVKELGKTNDFIGHIGGDDFIIVTSEDRYKAMCEFIIKRFDETIKSFYDAEDANRGSIETNDRLGVLRNFNIMTIAIAVVLTANKKISHYVELSEMAVSLKKLAKQNKRSSFVLERRE